MSRNRYNDRASRRQGRYEVTVMAMLIIIALLVFTAALMLLGAQLTTQAATNVAAVV